MKKVLVAALGALTLAGCASSEWQPEKEFDMSTSLLAGNTYIITHLNGVEVPEPYSATMKFHEDRVTGRGFCNSFSAIYDEDYQGDIVIDQVLFTQRACSEEAMNLDHDFSKSLQEFLVFRPTPVGFTATSETGSFQIMEYDFVEKQ